MANFDDLFEQPAAEAAPQPEPQEKPKKEWWQIKEEKQRRDAYARLDRMFKAFSEGSGDIRGYLDIHSRFDRYSARNALLIYDRCPHAQRIGNYKYWAERGVEIPKSERRNPIVILEPGNPYTRKDGSIGQNFYAKEVYDISQTSARGQQEPQVAYDERILLKALINNPPVPIRAVDQLTANGAGAMYDPAQDAILVQKGMSAQDIFRCVSLELAHVQLARGNDAYSREADGSQAYAVSYMICKKYGVDVQIYNVDRLKEAFRGMSPTDEIPAAFSDMEDAMGAINSRMARALGLSRASKSKEQQR